ncbi:MAG: hypothetical protein RBR26_11605 [Methanosarcina mazei]|nr:hypothetical protein [Methanosarcina mazei]
MMFSGCGGESGSSAVDGGNGGGQDSEQRAAMNEPDAIGSLPPVPMVPTK